MLERCSNSAAVPSVSYFVDLPVLCPPAKRHLQHITTWQRFTEHPHDLTHLSHTYPLSSGGKTLQLKILDVLGEGEEVEECRA